MALLKPICVNGSNCQGSSQLPPCVGSCGGGGGSGGGSFPEWNINDDYLVDTVVIKDGVLYIANSDIPPGTPFETGDIPGTWRALEAGTASIPPFNPESSYAQYRAVLYEGRLYISNTALIPGPFNPADWTEVLVTGAISTNDTVSVDLTGNGTAGDPLTASINLDPSEDNLLEVTPDGLMLNKNLIPTPGGGGTIISTGVTLNVDTVTGDDSTADGTFGLPFATVQAAMDAADAGDVVEVWPGSYATPSSVKTGTTLRATNGRVVFTPAALDVRVSNFRLENITVPELIISDSAGGVVFEKVTVVNGVAFLNQNTGTFIFNNLNCDGVFGCQSPGQGAAALTVIVLGDGTGSPAIQTDVQNGRVYVGNRQNVGNVLHRRGLLVLEDIVRVQNVDHTADAAPSNLLYVKNVSNFNPQTGVFATVTKTGTASFVFNNFARDPMTDESGFQGTKNIIEQARDIHGNYAPVNYQIESDSVSAHLKGIDEALSGISGAKTANIAYSLVGGWDANEILFAYVVAEIPGDIQFFVDFDGSFATSDVSFDSSIILEISPPGGGTAQPFGEITFNAGVVSFAGGGNLAEVGSTIILRSNDTSADFGFLAITLVGGVQP